jgi:hypothetical protein
MLSPSRFAGDAWLELLDEAGFVASRVRGLSMRQKYVAGSVCPKSGPTRSKVL